jgi:transcriptional regulator NrdR family protein
MHCPYCGSKHSEVVETRDSDDKHVLRLRIASKSSLSRVSTTSECLDPQYGQCIKKP